MLPGLIYLAIFPSPLVHLLFFIYIIILFLAFLCIILFPPIVSIHPHSPYNVGTFLALTCHRPFSYPNISSQPRCYCLLHCPVELGKGRIPLTQILPVQISIHELSCCCHCQWGEPDISASLFQTPTLPGSEAHLGGAHFTPLAGSLHCWFGYEHCFVRHPWDEMSCVEQTVPWELNCHSATWMPYESQQDTQS